MGFGKTIMEKLRLDDAEVDPVGAVAEKLRLGGDEVPGGGPSGYETGAVDAMQNEPEYADPQFFELRAKKKHKTARMREMLREGGYPELARYLALSNSHGEDEGNG